MLGTPVSLLVGIVLLLGAVVLFFLDKLRPAIARDTDKVYAVFILMAGLLALAIQEITLGESFQMILMAGMLTTVYIENVGKREPREIIPGPPVGNRPPPPRYDNRPPVRRGYRAELDDRPEFRGPMPPRMNPVQPPYRQDAAYAGRGGEQVRPPYEEYRGPAGRLQPSRPGNAGGPPENRYTDEARYGDRPPVPQGPPQNQRPPQRDSQRDPQRPYDGPLGRSPEPFREGPGNAPNPSAQMPEARTGERPPNRPSSAGAPDGFRDSAPAAGNGLSNGFDNSLRNGSDNVPANDSTNGDTPVRALNVRPLSEAPRFDDDYRPDRPGGPEGAPSY